MLGGIQMGEKARLVVNLDDATPAPLHHPLGAWNSVQNAIGGGPILLRDSSIVVDSAEEGISNDITDGPNSRTGVGITKDGKVMIVTIDSGSSFSEGQSRWRWVNHHGNYRSNR
jgi:exopolysaccharide biosynthesis protein